MNKAVLSFIILSICFGILFTIHWYDTTYNPVILRQEVIKPDLHLANASKYAKEHSYNRSMDQLKDAIDAMRRIEMEVDEDSRNKLEMAIQDVEVVLEEMRNDSLVTDDLNKAFTRALNVLTIAELRVSELLIDNEQSDKARIALKYGMYHLKNALKYTAGHKKDYEAHIYEEIDSLLDSRHVDHDQMIARLEFMISELDSLVMEEIH
jgi:cell division protein ZapA (FtsZ GTPase activity inhibitor)